MAHRKPQAAQATLAFGEACQDGTCTSCRADLAFLSSVVIAPATAPHLGPVHPSLPAQQDEAGTLAPLRCTSMPVEAKASDAVARRAGQLVAAAGTTRGFATPRARLPASARARATTFGWWCR